MPLSGGAAARAQRRGDHELPQRLCGQVRHVCGGRIRGVRALLLLGSAGRRDLPLALRVPLLALQAGGLKRVAPARGSRAWLLMISIEPDAAIESGAPALRAPALRAPARD